MVEFLEFWQFCQIILPIGPKLDIGPKVNLPNFGSIWPKIEIAPDRAKLEALTAAAPPFAVRTLHACDGLNGALKIERFDQNSSIKNRYP